MATPRHHIGAVLKDVLALGARQNSVRAESKGLVILHGLGGHVVTAWALYPRIADHDVWTRAPNFPRAIVRLRNALERA